MAKPLSEWAKLPQNNTSMEFLYKLSLNLDEHNYNGHNYICLKILLQFHCWMLYEHRNSRKTKAIKLILSALLNITLHLTPQPKNYCKSKNVHHFANWYFGELFTEKLVVGSLIIAALQKPRAPCNNVKMAVLETLQLVPLQCHDINDFHVHSSHTIRKRDFDTQSSL